MHQKTEYNKILLDHYKNPRNSGKLKNATYKSEAPNPACGDEIVVYLNTDDDKIAKIKYEARGCALMTASASLLSEYLIGKRLNEIEKLKREDIEKLIKTQISKSRDECIMLPVIALRKSLN